MKKCLMVVPVGLLVLALAGPAQAGRGPGGRSHRSRVSHPGSYHSGVHKSVVKSHYPTRSVRTSYRPTGYAGAASFLARNARKFSQGYYYPGQYHNYWTRSYYWGKYGYNRYWYSGWPSAYFYYPGSYITAAPPVVVQPAVATAGPPGYGPPPGPIPTVGPDGRPLLP